MTDEWPGTVALNYSGNKYVIDGRIYSEADAGIFISKLRWTVSDAVVVFKKTTELLLAKPAWDQVSTLANALADFDEPNSQNSLGREEIEAAINLLKGK